MIKALDLYISLRDIMVINEAAKNFLIYFKKILEEKKRNPDDALISKLISLNAEENVVSEEEFLSTCILLFIAGEETSVSLMSTGLYNLVKRKEVMNDLRMDTGKIQPVIEELIRYDTPVQIVGRIASTDTQLGGKPIPKGSTLTVCLGSANRDPEIFENADEFIPDRSPNKHLGFGGGAHYCLGDWLARIQTSIVIEELLSRYKTIDMGACEPQWNSNLAIRTLTEFPVALK
jgi:cytochrome P450